MFEKYGKFSLTIDALDENLRFYQFSELNIPRQLGSIKPVLPLIDDRKQKLNRQILDHTIAFVDVISWTRMSIQLGLEFFRTRTLAWYQCARAKETVGLYL